MLSLTPENKFQFLTSTLSDYRAYIHKLEGRAIQVVLSVSTGSIVLPVLTLKNVPDASLILRGGGSIFLVVVAYATVIFLRSTREHCNWLRKAIVRILQILGAYEDGAYIDIEGSDIERTAGFQNLSLLPKQDQEWGTTSWLDPFGTFIWVVPLATVAANIILWFG